MDVYLHSCQSVYQRNSICTARLDSLRHFRNIRHIWTQFHNDRLFRHPLHCFCDSLRRCRILPESDSALLDIRTGNVDFQQIHVLTSETLHYLTVVLCTPAAYIHDNLCVILPEKRNVPLHKHIDTRILKPDGIQHTAVYFSHPWRRIPRPRHICHTLCYHCPQLRQIYKFTILCAGAKRPGRSHHRVFQLHSGNIYSRINHNSTSDAKNTGPSLHTRLLCT